jgi:hypothetical protein
MITGQYLIAWLRLLWKREMPQGCCSRNCTGYESSQCHCGPSMGRRVSREPGSQETCFKEHERNLRNGRLRTGVNMCRQHSDSAAGRIGIFFVVLRTATA